MSIDREPLAPLRLAGQAAVYAACGALIVWLSSAPAYAPLPPGSAQVVLSLSHAGARATACRRLTPEEIAALAENMRRMEDCPRRRVPVRVELEMDGRTIHAAEHPPSGLFGDGTSNVYQRVAVAPGTFRVVARLRDNRELRGFDHVHEETVTLEPGRTLVVQFNAAEGGFRFR